MVLCGWVVRMGFRGLILRMENLLFLSIKTMIPPHLVLTGYAHCTKTGPEYYGWAQALPLISKQKKEDLIDLIKKPAHLLVMYTIQKIPTALLAIKYEPFL